MNPKPLGDLWELTCEIRNLLGKLDGTLTIQEYEDEIEKIIKQRIKQACEFYLRYKDNPDLLIEEHPEYEEQIRKIEAEKTDGIVIVDFYDKYNEWLFKLAFRGVLGDVHP